MSYNLGTKEEPIIVFVNFNGGMLDATIRCDSREAFDAAALYAGLFYEAMEKVTDEETGEVTQVATGEIKQAKGVYIDHIGPVMIQPAEYDSEGVEITPAVFDNRHHVNFRLVGTALEGADEYGILKWHKWSMAWSLGGSPDDVINAEEEALKLYGVSLIDADTIRSPSRVWL